MYQDIRFVSEGYAVIDKDTGTVLGTNLALVKMPTDPDEIEDIESSDSTAVDFATANGFPLYRFKMDGQ